MRRTLIALCAVGLCLPATTPIHAQPTGAAGEYLDPTVLRELAISFRDANWEAALQSAASTDAYLHADLVADGQSLPDIGVRIKGNSSSRAPGRKKPLNLGLDAFVAGQELAGYDTLNLNNMFSDPTLVREVLTYKILRPYLPTPRATFARMLANGGYFGLYSVVEQVEKTYLKAWFPSSGGILFKADPPGGFGGPAAQLAAPAQPQPGRPVSDLSWLGEDLARYRSSYELKSADDGDTPWIALRELTRVLGAPVAEGGVADGDLPAAAEKVLDVDGVLWYLAAHNLLDNFDSYYNGHNYFLYRSPEDGRFHVLSWDMNESFGVFPPPDNSGVTSDGEARIDPFLLVGGVQRDRPLLRRLLAVPRYRADYLAHYRILLAEVLDATRLTAEAGALQALIREAAQSDPNPLYSFDLFERGLTEDLRLGSGGPAPGGGGGGRAVPGLLRLARLRAEWLTARPDLAAPDLRLVVQRRSPEVPAPGEPVQVAVQLAGADMPLQLSLVYQVNGGAPVRVAMAPGDVSDFGSIPGQPAHAVVRYYVRAELGDGRSVFFPAANWTQPWSYTVAGAALPRGSTGALVLNELQADNKATLADPNGDYDDWVELYNRGTEAVSLSGYFLSDDPAEPQRFALPDLSLAPGAFTLIWCDSDGKQGADHAPFKLSKDGDALYLSTATETVDEVTFGPQATDASYARMPDGAPAWADCASPSPRAANTCGGSGPTPTATATATATATPTGTPPLAVHLFLPWAGRTR